MQKVTPDRLPSSFTAYWKNDTCGDQEKSGRDRFTSTGSDGFRAAGMRPGDLLYVFTIKEGVALLIGRMRVELIISRTAAVRRFRRQDLWDVKDWCISSRANATTLRYDRPLPLGSARKLRFITKSGETSLAFTKRHPRLLNHQTLRRIRRLTPESAHLLDSLLEGAVGNGKNAGSARRALEVAPIYEGARRTVWASSYERDPRAKKACIAHWGTSCIICRFDFAKAYGKLGKGYIHAHHLYPMADIRGRRETDPKKDLLPVCPNCHAMIHKRSPCLKVEELKVICGVALDHGFNTRRKTLPRPSTSCVSLS
jgi:hypothetical protein